MRELSRFRANCTLELGGSAVRWADPPHMMSLKLLMRETPKTGVSRICSTHLQFS